jgi:hypothetical protein
MWGKKPVPGGCLVGFPGGSDGKESTCNVVDLSSIPGLGRSPGGGHDNPLQYSFWENPMAFYDPWDCKESDATEANHTPMQFNS